MPPAPAGVRVFSPAQSMLRLIDRLSCTVTFGNANIPMPDTCVTADIDVAMSALRAFGSAVFKPLYSTKARGMCVIEAEQDPDQAERDIRAFREHNPVMYIQKKIDLPGRDIGMVFLGGRRDAYLDIPDGRLVRKVRTGMLFLQSEKYRIAAGPCVEYDNQVINFINAQYMNWLQQRSWLICHAAALVYQGRGFAIAGHSGGGKSTLMLNLLGHDSVSYITNDRLFIKKRAGETCAVGIPKLPRINPGTIVYNQRLQQLIEPQRRASLLALPPQELWELEDKYDVDVETNLRCRPYRPGGATVGFPDPQLAAGYRCGLAACGGQPSQPA